MRSGFKRSNRGYSLAEMLVVVAIIGVLSLISVPAFMNFRRSADFKAGMRAFTTDLRNARQSAITNSFDVRVEMQSGPIGMKQYRFFSSRDNGTTWTALQLPGSHGAVIASPGNIKWFSFSVWMESTTAIPDVDANGQADLVFHPNGTTNVTANPGTIVLRTDWKKIAFDKYTIAVQPSGQLIATGSHT